MPSCLFVLQRFFLRVDGVLVRVRDTRLYHRFGSRQLLREFCNREQTFRALQQVRAVFSLIACVPPLPHPQRPVLLRRAASQASLGSTETPTRFRCQRIACSH